MSQELEQSAQRNSATESVHMPHDMYVDPDFYIGLPESLGGYLQQVATDMLATDTRLPIMTTEAVHYFSSRSTMGEAGLFSTINEIEQREIAYVERTSTSDTNEQLFLHKDAVMALAIMAWSDEGDQREEHNPSFTQLVDKRLAVLGDHPLAAFFAHDEDSEEETAVQEHEVTGVPHDTEVSANGSHSHTELAETVEVGVTAVVFEEKIKPTVKKEKAKTPKPKPITIGSWNRQPIIKGDFRLPESPRIARVANLDHEYPTPDWSEPADVSLYRPRKEPVPAIASPTVVGRPRVARQQLAESRKPRTVVDEVKDERQEVSTYELGSLKMFERARERRLQKQLLDELS